MPSKSYKVLTDSQVSHFLQHGYVVIPQCFAKGASDEWTKDVWTRLGMDPNGKSTWTRERTNMPEHRRLNVPGFAPKGGEAIRDLVGGEERITEKSKTWSDSFIVNLGKAEGEGKDYGPYKLEEWHVYGKWRKWKAGGFHESPAATEGIEQLVGTDG